MNAVVAPFTRDGSGALRLALSGAGLVAAAALLWFVGPSLQLGDAMPLAAERERWLAIGALLALALLVAFARALRRRRHNRRMVDGLVGSAPPGAQEVALLEQRFRDAMATLRQRRIGGRRSRLLAALAGRPFLHELPWYLIVGAPGAGKTTALANSGLEFPLQKSHGKAAVRGIGGTRHCDWWFTSSAVLLDTAGRYTTQDSDREADRTAWLGFLDLLARHRPQRPIDGVLMALSAADLLHPDRDKRIAHARELRARIDELTARLGVRFPIYLLVTKTDLLAGFVEFFADFDKDERAQVWGLTLPLGDEIDPLARAGSELAALEKRLNECLLERLHGEHDRERRAAIYAFPQQWRVLREALLESLEAAFAPATGGSGSPRPLLRGVYFTSATQEGTPMDRALGGLARALGLSRRIVAPLRPSGKTFFVTALLRDVVFAEAGLAGTNRGWRRRRALLQWGAVGATGALVAVALVLVGRAWRDNAAAVDAVAARLQTLQPALAAARAASRTDVVALLPVLDGVAALGRDDPQRPAGWLSMGLDQRARFAAAAQDAERRLLADAFLPRLAARLEQRLRADTDGQIESIYEALKGYLMLFGGRHFDARALRAFLVADWEATLPAAVGAAQRDALRRHLDRLLAGGEVGAPSQADSALIAKARQRVAGAALPQRVLHRLQQADERPPIGIETLAGPTAHGRVVRASGQRGIAALYGRSALPSLRARAREVLQQLAAERDWVLGAADGPAAAAPPLEPLLEQVERLHAAETAKAWDAFLGDLRLKPTPTLAATAELALALSRSDSPLLPLLAGLARELPPGPRYDALRAYASGQPAPAADLLPAFGKLAAHLTAVDDALQRRGPPPPGDAARELAALAARAPQPLDALFGDFAAGATRQLFAALREPLGRQLAAEVGAPCTKATDGRYPLARGAAEEMSRDEFARLFGPGGAFDAFFRRQLAPFVDASGRAWTVPTAQGREPLDTLAPFQRAQAAREAFFAGDGGRFGVRLELKLLDLDPGIGQFAIDIDGRTVRFARDTRAPQTLLWPAGGSGRIQLVVGAAGGTGGGGYAFDGPWALLRLLDRVRVEPGSSADRLNLTFDVEGRKARFEARSPGTPNPIRFFDGEPFQCPKRL